MNLKQQILKKTQYKTIPKVFIEKLGHSAALLLTHFIDLTEMLGEEFYQQKDRMLGELGMKRKTFETALNLLSKKNLIYISRKNGCKNTYGIIQDQVEVLLKTEVLSYAEKQVLKNSQQVLKNSQQVPKNLLASTKEPASKYNNTCKDNKLEIIDENQKITTKSKDKRDPENSSVDAVVLPSYLDDFLHEFQEQYKD